MFEKEEEEVFGCVREGGKCGVTKSFDPPPSSFLPFLVPPLGQWGRGESNGEGESLFFLPEGVANEKEEKEEKEDWRRRRTDQTLDLSIYTRRITHTLE